MLGVFGSCGDGGGSDPADAIAVIVGFNGAVDAATFEKHGGVVRRENAVLSYLSGTLPPGNAAALAAEPNVAYVEEDHVVSATRLRFAPALRRDQTSPWGLDHIAADYCWTSHGTVNGSDGAYGAAHDRTNHDTTPGVTRIRVAVCDTGIAVNHPDLLGQAVWGANFAGGGNKDNDGHGTHVAGTIAARDNTIGSLGIAPCALTVAVKVLGNSGFGSTSDVADGITWAANNDCQVINLSLGASAGSTTLQTAVNYAWNDKNVVICAAAGNDDVEDLNYPAAYTNCIAVVAIQEGDVRWSDGGGSGSNYGSWTDISAPGDGIYSTYVLPGNFYTYATATGTSMATPHVAGVAALVWAKVHAQDDDSIKTNTYVRNLIETNGAVGLLDTNGQIPNLVDPWSCLLDVPQ